MSRSSLSRRARFRRAVAMITFTLAVPLMMGASCNEEAPAGEQEQEEDQEDQEDEEDDD